MKTMAPMLNTNDASSKMLRSATLTLQPKSRQRGTTHHSNHASKTELSLFMRKSASMVSYAAGCGGDTCTLSEGESWVVGIGVRFRRTGRATGDWYPC